MVDVHSHILPRLDDGSSSIEESLKLVDSLKKQGVSHIVATPHFLADKLSVEDFTERRSKAYNDLMANIPPDSPKILLGAEIRYYEGISRFEGLRKLAVEGSRVLLLEMDGGVWSQYTVSELISLTNSGYTVILAHIERFIKDQREDNVNRLLKNDVLMQVNASYFVNRLSRKKALKLLKNNQMHFLGSDCHNLSARPPRIGEAADIIKAHFGEDFFQNMVDFSKTVFLKDSE